LRTSHLRAAGPNRHEFFEEFFPTAIDLPKPSPDVLKQMLCDEIATSFELDWFTDAGEKKEFAEGLDALWKNALVHLCSNIRKTALLVTDVEAAGQLVRGR
jgi:hypothetical protein